MQAWSDFIQSQRVQPYFKKIEKYVELQRKEVNVFPKAEDVFNAFKNTEFDQVKVVILGQDPYHGEGQAHGLAFSVQNGVKIPPSLKNIYLELKADIGCLYPNHGDLSSWAKQGVLLLNSSLSVEEGKTNSHLNLGWNILTEKIISKLSDRGEVIFLLWGKFAQQKMNLIDEQSNNIFFSFHPSPLSSYRGFFGSRPFSKINNTLLKSNKEPIDWQID